ncbi:MAG TPA: META domain-containing protein [Allosphingosinicella sp.]|nr:META domain-containing protein [Allosphingosinicella sp.]
MSLLAAAALALVQPASAPYAASGSEPFWRLEIAGGRMVFHPGDDSRISVATPRRQAVRNGYRLVTRQFIVTVRHAVCEDEAERRYRDTVSVTTLDRVYDGCGGTLLPPVALADTDWRIEAIGNVRVDGDAYVMSFHEGRIDARAGCNRLSGAYRERGGRLVPGPIAGTRMACPGARMAHERAFLAALRGGARISYPAGDVLVLTGSGGTIRLRRV